MKSHVTSDTWAHLRAHTNARVALGRAGHAMPTDPLLAFSLAHAQARDAVHRSLDVAAMESRLRQQGFETLSAHSAAPDRPTYLRRPDLGRRLSAASREALTRTRYEKPDLVFVLADGLSALAAERQAIPFLLEARARVAHWRIGPVVVAEQARVALGDEIGEALGARMVVVLIGERPGLSSPDSLGIYLTYAPRVGCHDAQRNCISNVRPAGLGFDVAAFKLQYLIDEAFRLGLTGVGLKENSGTLLPPNDAAAGHLQPDAHRSDELPAPVKAPPAIPDGRS